MGVEIGLFPFSLITSYHASLPDVVVSTSHCEKVMRERKFSGVDRGHCLIIHLQVAHGVPIPTILLKLLDIELMRHCQVRKPRHVREIGSTEGV